MFESRNQGWRENQGKLEKEEIEVIGKRRRKSLNEMPKQQ